MMSARLLKPAIKAAATKGETSPFWVDPLASAALRRRGSL